MRENRRERTLLRLIMEQQRVIADLSNRLMYMAGYTWELPAPVPLEPEDDDGGEALMSSLHGLPPGYEEEE